MPDDRFLGESLQPLFVFARGESVGGSSPWAAVSESQTREKWKKEKRFKLDKDLSR